VPNRDCIAFWVGGASVTIGEVLRAALFRGDLDPALARLSRKMECADQAVKLGLDPDGEAIDQMAIQFRYDNDLISAEETEAWLESRGLDADQFQAYFEGSYWMEVLKGTVFPDRPDHLPDTAGLTRQLEAEVLMSGGFGPLAVELSRRLMVRQDPESRSGPSEIDQALKRFHEISGVGPDRISDWLASIDRDQAWFAEMLEMEEAYRIRRQAVLAQGQLLRELAASRLALTRLEIESVEFDAMDAALEGHLCVRNDGLSLEDVARESRYPFKRVEILAENIPEDQRQNLLCARIGDVLEPSTSGGLISLLRVLSKTEPGLDDPFVRTRIEQRVLNAHFSGAKAGEIRWLIS